MTRGPSDMLSSRYIEDFWYVLSVPKTTRAVSDLLHRYESYLSHSDPVVLALNPFFVLE